MTHQHKTVEVFDKEWNIFVEKFLKSEPHCLNEFYQKVKDLILKDRKEREEELIRLIKALPVQHFKTHRKRPSMGIDEEVFLKDVLACIISNHSKQ